MSPDGRRVYFVDQRKGFSRMTPATLKHVSSDGGTASVVLSNLTAGAWDVTDSGIVFLASRAAGNPADPDVVMRYDFVEGQSHPIGTVSFPVAPAFANRFLIVSRDGRWAIASHIDRFERDIMVLDNFR